jgi:predicted metal-dependent enzyme (double-stranded beta helix superfamily)
MQTDQLCSALVARLDEAVNAGSVEAITREVKGVLEHELAAGGIVLPEAFRATRAEGYARRLLHRDPQGRYTAIVMTWGPGQGTPVHDHGGLWCVEGVVEGQIAVTQYDVTEEADHHYRIQPRNTVVAGSGEAGRLIPPTDHHVIENARPDAPSLTLHVYGGDLEECLIFVPEPDGRFVSERRHLSFHD